MNRVSLGIGMALAKWREHAQRGLWALVEGGGENHVIFYSLEAALQDCADNELATATIRPCMLAFPVVRTADAEVLIERLVEDGADVSEWSDFGGQEEPAIDVPGVSDPHMTSDSRLPSAYIDLARRMSATIREWAIHHGCLEVSGVRGRQHVEVRAWKFTGPERVFDLVGGEWKERTDV